MLLLLALLFGWERGVALRPAEDGAPAMYLWFYEWNMFEAVAPGQHTHGTYKLDRRVRGNEATIGSPALRLRVKAVPDGAEMLLTVTNRTPYAWPPEAAIIPCWTPGQAEGADTVLADREHDKTEFLSKTGISKLASRAIHFNPTLGLRGEFAFSYKWPTSEEDAYAGALVRQAAGGQWVTGIGWQDYLSVQGHNPWNCMHVAVRAGPLAPGKSKTVRGRLYLFRGTTGECWRRLAGYGIGKGK